MKGSVSQLHRLARRCGLQTAYYDVNQRRQVASTEGLLSMLNTLGIPIQSVQEVPRHWHDYEVRHWSQGIEPVVVAWQGFPAQFVVRLPRQHEGVLTCRIDCETGETIFDEHNLSGVMPSGDARIGGVEYLARAIPLPEKIPLGYHRLIAETDDRHFEALLLSAPRRAFYPETRGKRDWGGFLPLYSLHTERSWGAGNYTDLRELAEWIGSQGGTLVGTLPLMPAFLEDRPDPSPYSPISRLFWNEFYIDVEAIPELQHTPAARELLESTESRALLTELRSSDRIEYQQQMRLARGVLAQLAEQFYQERPERFQEFTRYVETNPLVRDYARFRAAFEKYKVRWQDWPERPRSGTLTDEDYDEAAERYHLYAQWIASQQLDDLTDRAAAAGTGLYLDLPLGVRPDGFDVWRQRELFLNASAGAPPDTIFTKGQNWGFSPLHPQRLREQQYQYVIAFLRAQLQHCRVLRIDHVMGLHRLYCIPHGSGADQGVYVQFHADEFYAILNLESHRHQVGIIGENLGTVPTHVNQAMRRNNIRGMHVLEYFLNPQVTPVLKPAPRGELAAINTHDMPTFAAYWDGADIDDRFDLGLMSPEEAEQERQARRKLRDMVVAFLQEGGWLPGGEDDAGSVLRALLEYLAAGPAATLIVNLEDLWLETRPQNLPGTSWERPNWRRKARYRLEEFRELPAVLELLRDVDELRRRKAGTASPMERNPS